MTYNVFSGTLNPTHFTSAVTVLLLKPTTDVLVKTVFFIMAALRSRCGHYIFALWFLSSIFFFYSSPNLNAHRLDVYHTSTHGVALVRI